MSAVSMAAWWAVDWVVGLVHGRVASRAFAKAEPRVASRAFAKAAPRVAPRAFGKAVLTDKLKAGLIVTKFCEIVGDMRSD
jgi:hypothetical protein